MPVFWNTEWKLDSLNVLTFHTYSIKWALTTSQTSQCQNYVSIDHKPDISVSELCEHWSQARHIGVKTMWALITSRTSRCQNYVSIDHRPDISVYQLLYKLLKHIWIHILKSVLQTDPVTCRSYHLLSKWYSRKWPSKYPQWPILDIKFESKFTTNHRLICSTVSSLPIVFTIWSF